MAHIIILGDLQEAIDGLQVEIIKANAQYQDAETRKDLSCYSGEQLTNVSDAMEANENAWTTAKTAIENLTQDLLEKREALETEMT